MNRLIPASLVTALTLVLSACGGRSSADAPPQLHLACQTLACECTQESSGLFSSPKKAEIVWKPNGEASCPAGYTLRRTSDGKGDGRHFFGG